VNNLKVSISLLVLGGGLVAILVIAVLSASAIWPTPPAVDIEHVADIARQYVTEFGPNYRIEEIMEFSNNFYIMVQEASTGINAFELLADHQTGQLSLEAGANMMWNQKYGHMRPLDNTTASMPIAPHEASQYAQQWLDRYVPGASIEEVNPFYGYYTIDVSTDGRIFGMLSVNGFSGDVWYHTWHGEFIRMEEYH
jgi:hypothetical protein